MILESLLHSSKGIMADDNEIIIKLSKKQRQL